MAFIDPRRLSEPAGLDLAESVSMFDAREFMGNFTSLGNALGCRDAGIGDFVDSSRALATNQMIPRIGRALMPARMSNCARAAWANAGFAMAWNTQ